MSMMKARTALPCVLFTCVMSLAVSMGQAKAGSEPPPDQSVYALLREFYGHDCAGSISGARLGLSASQALKEAGGTGRFSARYYNLSCPVDGNQQTNGSHCGNSKLSVQDRDEQRLILTASGNTRQVEARLTKQAAAMGKKSLELNRKAATLFFSSPERLHLEKEVEEIHFWLKTAPDEDVVIVTMLTTPLGKH